MHRLARSERPWLARLLIRALMTRYAIDLRDAREPDPAQYRSLNAFFTRALRSDARPQPAAPLAIASPADGRLSQFGRLNGPQLLQAKGQWYAVSRLLALDDAGARPFLDGHFATIYLAPHNYHRVHAPCAGSIDEILYVPGALFSVNTRTARVVPGLFARNERVILRCSGEHGAFAVVLVGAMLVGSMRLECCDLAPYYRKREFMRRHFAQGIPFARGAELGRFDMGSTVILVFARDAIEWNRDAESDTLVQVGQAIGKWRTPSRVATAGA
jgi:phosphatidylserine decarboxylase